MTNRIALALALAILAVFVIDAVFFGGTLPVFLGRKFVAFLDWLAFWR